MEEIKKLIKVHDIEENGVISFEEFKAMLLDKQPSETTVKMTAESVEDAKA